jgi:hypothetical protein
LLPKSSLPTNVEDLGAFGKIPSFASKTDLAPVGKCAVA